MIVLAMNSIAYFSPDEASVLLNEVHRLLKPKGIFIMDQLNPDT